MKPQTRSEKAFHVAMLEYLTQDKPKEDLLDKAVEEHLRLCPFKKGTHPDARGLIAAAFVEIYHHVHKMDAQAFAAWANVYSEKIREMK
jgi:hypothetical protein